MRKTGSCNAPHLLPVWLRFTEITMKLALPIVTAFSLVPVGANAHPHIFVNTGLTVIISTAGQLEAVEITWAYDEFYSLLIFEDLALDADFDGELTQQELDKLQGFDLQWSEGYEGDSYLTRNGVKLALGAGEHLLTEVSNGQITTRHRRELAQPVSADGVVFRAYDPTYYTAYTLNQGLEVRGDCKGEITPPDLNAAYNMVEELLYSMPASQTNDAYPEVGEAFADVVRLSCE